MKKDGQICTKEESDGCKVHHKITQPEFGFCGDEVGGNISMKGDGHNEGELLLIEKGNAPQKGQHLQLKAYHDWAYLFLQRTCNV